MKRKVRVIDDTLRANAVEVVTPQMRVDHLKKHGRLLLASVVLVKDRQHRQIQRVENSEHVYEDKHLQEAVRRAKRWMRSDKFPKVGAPHHIALAMAAFHAADPDGFRKEVKECNS